MGDADADDAASETRDDTTAENANISKTNFELLSVLVCDGHESQIRLDQSLVRV